MSDFCLGEINLVIKICFAFCLHFAYIHWPATLVKFGSSAVFPDTTSWIPSQHLCSFLFLSSSHCRWSATACHVWKAVIKTSVLFFYPLWYQKHIQNFYLHFYCVLYKIHIMEYYFFFDRCSALENFWFSSMLTASLGCACTYFFEAEVPGPVLYDHCLHSEEHIQTGNARYMISIRFKWEHIN